MLITKENQDAIKAIDANWCRSTKVVGGITNFEQLAFEVEESLSDILGVALLQDIQENPETTENALLLGGGSFVNCENQTVKFKGLIYILAYLNYSRYLIYGSLHDSATGFVTKNREEATSVRDGVLKSEQSFSDKIAYKEIELLKSYLNENATLYPLWNCQTVKTKQRQKFISLRNTKY